MKKILVPADFSERSQYALRFAIDLARAANAQVFVVHMVELPMLPETTFGIQPHPLDPELLDRLESKATSAFERMMAKYPTDVTVRFKAIHDYVVPGIRIFIEENAIDLVVMSTQGASGLDEFVIGSTAEKIARFSPVPVISLPQPAEFNKIGNIVFPNVLDLNQSESVEKLKEIQKLCNAKLHVLLINTPGNFYNDEQARQHLDRFARHYNLENYTLNVRNHQFERSGILSFMNEVNADMLAMGTHGRTGLSHFFKGSIAEKILNRIDHPIWTCKLMR